MERRKTTVYLDPDVLTAVKVLPGRASKVRPDLAQIRRYGSLHERVSGHGRSGLARLAG
jgi:hypothetical protein